MPTLGNALDFSKYEARNIRHHQLGTAPSSPVTGQMYYNTADNTLYWWDGSAWVSARGGASATPPSTTSSLGTIQLAGDLAGTATSPQIAAGVITDVDVAAANKDGIAGTASMRTLGTGAQQAAAGNDARFTDARAPTAHHVNHEPGGSDPMAVDQPAGTASLRTLGFGVQQAMRGNVQPQQMNSPTAPFSMNNNQITNLSAPTFSTDAANKGYVDQTTQGLDAKVSVKAASTANLTLSANQTVDGIALVNLDRVLVKDQSTPAQNGIYVVSAGAWQRAVDMDNWGEVPSAYVWVEQGTAQADTGWVCTADQGGTLDTTAMPWTQFSGAGQITAGNGLTKTGNNLDVGAGAGITVNADTIQVANNGITNAMIADGAIDISSADITGTLGMLNGGTGATTPAQARINLTAAGKYTSALHGAGTTISVPQATHQLAPTSALMVQCMIAATGAVILPDVVISPIGDVTITFGVSQSANTIRTVIFG
jgi:Repeat of unknown function (DUF5907)